MTQKPELGTCRTASKPATHWIDNLKPHIKTQNCVGWQALPPSQEGTREQCPSCHCTANVLTQGESGAGNFARSERQAARKECAEIARHFANDKLSPEEWPKYGLVERQWRCDGGFASLMADRIAAAIERLDD